MPATEGESWSTSQLVEFLGVLMEQPDEAHARRAAVEQALEALDGDVGLLFGGDQNHLPLVTVGLPPDDDRVACLVGLEREGTAPIDLRGFGACRVALVALDVDRPADRLVVLRLRQDDFLANDMLLLHGMAWMLSLVLRKLHLVAELHERQRVLEQLARVQRAIAGRAAVSDVADEVTNSALSLIGSDFATLHLVKGDELGVVSVSATTRENQAVSWARRLSAAIADDVHRRGALVRTDEPAHSVAVPAELDTDGAGAAMGAPVRENGRVVGSLVVVSVRPGHTFAPMQEQSLLTFADQVSVALSDAKTLAAAQQAFHDPVTGLPNRIQLLEHLERALGQRRQVNVFFIDLDRFKSVNDTLGHAAGDELLRQVGRRLRQVVREDDCVARMGGDEFAVLMADASTDAVRRTGRRMVNAVEKPYLVGRETVVIGASIGVASGQHPIATGELLRIADSAMYTSKRAGGNRVTTRQPKLS
jgi:diguanylate cyclase (GGDEF)-like protein